MARNSVKQYAEHCAAQGGPLAPVVDIRGTRRTASTRPPPALAAELADLRLQLHYAERAVASAIKSRDSLRAAYLAKGGKL